MMGSTMRGIKQETALDAPRVSIIVVNWNTKALLLDCLRSIREETPAGLHELIVVDNGSSDGSSEAVRRTFDDVTVIANSENLGYALASNQGSRIARGEYVLLVNTDTIARERAVEHLVHFADENPDAGAVGCRLTYADGRSQASCFRFPNLRGLCLASLAFPRMFPDSPKANWDGYGGRDWSQRHEVDFAMGSFLLIRIAAARELAWFDGEFFLYGEEADLSYRLRKASWKTLYYPGAHVVHLHGGSATDWATRAWAYEAKQRAILLFLCKHNGLASAWLGNVIMLAGMPPRLVAWTFSDLADSLRYRRPPFLARLRRASILRFHLAALLRPAVIRRSWARPASVASV